MRMIEANLAVRGITVLARSMVRTNWEKNRSFLEAMANSDLIVINGEGTLHHGSRHGERLLKVVNHPARANKPVALINALYQDNPEHWGRYLEKMSLISTRDSRSAAAVTEASGLSVDVVPDLSLSAGAEPRPGMLVRDRLLIGDSVSRNVSASLLALRDMHPEAYFLPILRTIKPSKPHFPLPLRLLRQGYIELHARAFALSENRVLYSRSEPEFIAALRRGRLHVTGRFHAICFCLFTRTPFLAVGSNSWKIEALLEDFGLGKRRLVTQDQVATHLEAPDELAFTDEEQRAITAGLTMSHNRTARLFDRLKEIAVNGTA